MNAPVTLNRHGAFALIETNNPPVNAMAHHVRVALIDAVAQAARSDAAAIIIACKGRTFFSGADIAELDYPVRTPGLLELEEACRLAPQPVIAVMHGSVLGGGMVVAYCADYRVAAPGTIFGMPEVKLGLLATFGGTQFLPRLVGMTAALDLLIGANQIDLAASQAMGFVDAIGNLDSTMAMSSPLQKRPVRFMHPEPTQLALTQIDRFATGLDTDWEAPHATLNAARTGVVEGLEAGLARESELFEQLRASRQSHILRRHFFADRALNKIVLAKEVELQLRATGGERRQLRALGQALIDQYILPSAELVDAAIVRTLGWPAWKADVMMD